MIRKLTIDSDASEKSVLEAAEYFANATGRWPAVLFSAPDEAAWLRRLAKMYGMSLIVVPQLTNSAWGVARGEDCVWSPGA